MLLGYLFQIVPVVAAFSIRKKSGNWELDDDDGDVIISDDDVRARAALPSCAARVLIPEIREISDASWGVKCA